MSEKTKEVLKEFDLKDASELREALSNLAWDCASEWLEKDGVAVWSEKKVRRTAINIIDSLTEGDLND